jgi:hypothetical protein
VRRTIAVLCTVAAFACSSGERYTYTQRTAGGRTEPVRIDKQTGRTEVLTQRAGESPRWVVVEEAPAAGAVAELTTPERQPFSAADAGKVFHECRFLPDSGLRAGKRGGLECTLTNASQWDLLHIDLFISFDGFEKKYVMDAWSEFGSPYSGSIPLSLSPGETATWSVLFTEQGQSFRVIRMMGYPHNR